MKELKFTDFFDQKQPVSHIAIVVLSLLLTFVLGKSGKFNKDAYDIIFVFVMLVSQLEVFIFFGGLLFIKVNFDRKPVEVTKVVVARLIIFLAACMLASMTLFIVIRFIADGLTGRELSKVIPDFFRYEIKNWFRSTLQGLLFGSIIFIILLWQTSLRREQKLREQNLVFQNETLKSQVNPHFLFNSLNTVSSLISTNPEAAESFISNLSTVYRYILENSQKDLVPLQSEIEFVTNYFNLHRVRDENKINLSIEVTATERFKILPVSLQILTENAIKHNTATRENPLNIKISVVDDFIEVTNNVRKKASQLITTGIGLKNLSERVVLITGKNLIVTESDQFFTVKIPLVKNEHTDC